jgi:phosphohistidine phosphatase
MGMEIGLLRHGKSDWHSSAESDHDRPLAKRGVEGARLVGGFLQQIGRIPDRVYSSSAVRARTTAELAAEEGEWRCGLEVTRELYATEPERVFEFLRELETDLRRVLLVGHNPTWEEFLAALLGGGRFRLVTASLAWVEVDCDSWAECRPGVGVLAWLVTPKILGK